MESILDIPTRLETLDELRIRTKFIYEPQFEPGFGVNPNVSAKVAEDGSLLPYAGNTVVLTLPEAVKREILLFQRTVYDRAGWCLSRPLPEESFHMTLHDLESGAPSPELEARVQALEESASALTGRIAASGVSVQLRSTGVYCMAGTSLVLGLEPTDEESCRSLMAIYALFERLRPLGYPLTPHVTLGYLRPIGYNWDQLESLRAAVNACKKIDGIYFETPISAAEYMRFSDMATWQRYCPG